MPYGGGTQRFYRIASPTQIAKFAFIAVAAQLGQELIARPQILEFLLGDAWTPIEETFVSFGLHEHADDLRTRRKNDAIQFLSQAGLSFEPPSGD